jgi:hypothetical protein
MGGKPRTLRNQPSENGFSPRDLVFPRLNEDIVREEVVQ